MNKITSFVLILLLSIVAVSAAPVTVQDGALNVSGNFFVNLNKLFVDSSGGKVGINTSTPSAPLEVNGLIKATNWGNVTIASSQVVGGGFTDTNETTRFNALVNTDCSGTDKVVGVLPNGTVLCSSDVDTDTNKKGDNLYLTNDSATIFFNETKLNQTIDLRDDDTTYTNGTGISLSGNTFSVILSYFQGLFVELTDSFGGDVSGTYGNIQITADSHTLHWDNVTSKPNLDTNGSDDLNTSTAFGGDISGTYNTLQVTDNSHSLHWDNVSSKPANLDTDSTNDLTTASSWSGDLSGTGLSPQVQTNSVLSDIANVSNTGTIAVGGDLSGTVSTASVKDNSVLSHWDNVSNKPANLDTDSTNDLTTSASFGGDASGTYDNLQIKENSTTLSCSNVTGATSNLCTIVDTNTGNTSAQILAVIEPQGYYNVSRINTTSLENESGIIGVKYSWVTSTVASSVVGGDLSGTVSSASVQDNSVLSHWDNVSNKPANLDTDSTNDLTTASSWSGDLSGTGLSPQVQTNSVLVDVVNVSNTNTIAVGGDLSGTVGAAFVTDNSHLLHYNNITGANSSVSQMINDTTDLINNNSDAVLRFLNVTSGITVGSPSRWVLNTTELSPVSDDQGNLGSFSTRFANLYFMRGRFNVTSEAPSFPGTVLIRGKQALRITGAEGFFQHGGQINFGDDDLAYIREPQDDLLEIRGNAGITLNGTTKIPSIAAGAGTDYVCINTAGQLSSGASCTKFEGLQASSEVLTDNQFKVKNILSRAYPSDFPLGDLRGKTKEYIYTIAFNLQGITMEGKIKVPGNMDPVEVPYYLKQKIQSERGINSLVEAQISSAEVGKVYGLSQVQYVEPPAKAKN
ncbi:MAG: hypothetical protein Q8R47_02160 [Nanoarchaeota archaeon]|nr:hypothetical protein [Nanoarchaeota archaeon]